MPSPPEYTEAEWVPHCDDERCDLGRFRYECPACHKTSSDYDVWWDYEALILGNVAEVSFKCEKCHAELVAYYEREEYETRVRRARSNT